MNLVTWILDNWRVVLIGLVIALVAALCMRLDTVTAQRDLAEANLDSYKQQAKIAADAAEKESNDAVESAKQQATVLVEQAKKDAWANYKARYGSGNAACGIRADGLRDLRPGSSRPSDEGAGKPDAASGERLVIEACARDAGRLDAFIELCKQQQCEVVEGD